MISKLSSGTKLPYQGFLQAVPSQISNMITTNTADLPGTCVPAYDLFNPEHTTLVDDLTTRIKHTWHLNFNEATHFIYADPTLHHELRRYLCSFAMESLQILERTLERCSGESNNYTEIDGSERICIRVRGLVLWVTTDAFSWWIEQFRTGNVTDFRLFEYAESPADENSGQTEHDAIEREETVREDNESEKTERDKMDIEEEDSKDIDEDAQGKEEVEDRAEPSDEKTVLLLEHMLQWSQFKKVVAETFAERLRINLHRIVSTAFVDVDVGEDEGQDNNEEGNEAGEDVQQITSEEGEEQSEEEDDDIDDGDRYKDGEDDDDDEEKEVVETGWPSFWENVWSEE